MREEATKEQWGRLYELAAEFKKREPWTGDFEETPLKRYEIDCARFTDSVMIEKIRKEKKAKENWEVDEWDMFEEEGAEEEILGSLGELGFDIDKLKNNAYNMSEDEFVESMMTDLTRILEQGMGDIFDDSDEVEHELKNRKQKADAVRNFFGQGTMPREYYDEVEKFIEADLADSWEDLLGESTKLQLSDMAGRLKAQVKKSAPKGQLIEAIMNRVHEESSALMGLLTEDEQDALEMMRNSARDMEGWWELEDFPLTMEQALKLLNYAFIDIGWYTSDEDMTLVLRAVEEF